TQIVVLAARNGLTALYFRREFAVVGGLMSYGTNADESYRVLGVYAGRILKGENPGDLPIQALGAIITIIGDVLGSSRMVILRSKGGTVSLVRENDTSKPLAFRYWAYWSAIFQSVRDPTAIISIDFPVDSLLANLSPIVASKGNLCGPMMLRIL